MDNDKSILEKIADTVKDIATLATDAASHAMKAEEPPLKAASSRRWPTCRWLAMLLFPIP